MVGYTHTASPHLLWQILKEKSGARAQFIWSAEISN